MLEETGYGIGMVDILVGILDITILQVMFVHIHSMTTILDITVTFNGDTNWQGLTTYGKMRIGQTAKTNWRRNDYTGNSDYWVGTMGWGTRDFNEVMTWGSGFIDTWSNPANQPSGTSHWVGVQTYHYTNAYNSAYGWQLVGGPIGNLRFRQSWPNAGAWRTVVMHDVNDG